MPEKPKQFGLYRKKRTEINRDAARRAKSRKYPPWSPHWRAIRRQVLDGEPMCRHCYAQGRYTEATEVDHVNGDAHDNSPGNLQPLCKPCHSRKTAREAWGAG